MSFTSSDLTAVERAIATGELRVEIDGKMVIYRSIDDLRQARDMIRSDLQATGASPAVVRASFAQRTRD